MGGEGEAAPGSGEGREARGGGGPPPGEGLIGGVLLSVWEPVKGVDHRGLRKND